MDEPDNFQLDDDELSDIEPQSFFIRAVTFELLLGVVGLVAGWVVGFDARQWIPAFDDLPVIFSSLGWGVIATLPMLLAVFILERLQIAGVQELSTITKDRLLAPMRRLTFMELFAIAVCAGLGEELLFRGFLQAWLIGPLAEAGPGRIFIGLMVASIVFGLVHALTPTYFILAAVVGFYLGGIAIATENLLIPIVAHALYDAVQLVTSVREENAKTSEG
ncbi:CAAX amino terminal protease self- immunity [Roseimaritima multifibrata]|uniref:CAAX amino terminal protease self-immunity n=1 Tax=Roseimaritima multifibrata TaxID=1930274 RepID=A0A517MEV5_9BACT|nr:type II CAAX endopeptidase family protein [Roseimaritima multifibrata]QDS93424.1 CAAX amino terminal protease self- immunity [Roseimaritima multifibrata]